MKSEAVKVIEMVDMNKLIVASKDKKNKAGFNALLLDMFNEFGKAENDAIEFMVPELVKAGVSFDGKDPRKSLIGKLGVMGVKTIVKPKPKAVKKDDGPTKKELINELLSMLGADIDEIDTITNMRKGDIKNLTNLVQEMEMEMAIQ